MLHPGDVVAQLMQGADGLVGAGGHDGHGLQGVEAVAVGDAVEAVSVEVHRLAECK